MDREPNEVRTTIDSQILFLNDVKREGETNCLLQHNMELYINYYHENYPFGRAFNFCQKKNKKSVQLFS
jgi:hypothetical protein